MSVNGNRLTAATYNVHKCVGIDIRYDPERIAKVVKRIDADLIGLQEVDNRSGMKRLSAQMDYIARATGYTALQGPTIRRPDGHYGNVLLTRWPIVESNQVNLAVSGREPRGAIDALVRIRGEDVRVIVVHLGLSASERWFQFCKLAEVVRESSGLLILLGDLNEWYPRSRGLALIHRLMGRPPSSPSFPGWCPFIALDRIWVRPREALVNLRVHATPLSRIASDHLPVVAEIALEEHSANLEEYREAQEA